MGILTRNQYCQVCGSEVLSDRKRKAIDRSEKLKPKGKGFRKKLTISILAVFILVSITVPSVYIPLARRAQYPGKIELLTITTYTDNLEEDQLTLIMETVEGIVNIEKIHLHSLDREVRYQSMMVKQEYAWGAQIIRTFMLQKDILAKMNYGLSVLIDYRYGNQWLTFYFEST